MHLKRLPVYLALLLLSACGFLKHESNTPERYSEPRYNTERPIELNVNRVNIISEFSPSFARPNVEHLLPISIEKTAKLWVKDRLEAANTSSEYTANFIIKDASCTEELEKSDKPFHKDSLSYKARLNVVLEISDQKTLSRAETQINTWRELKIPADSSIETKEKYWNDMVKKLFDEFDIQMDKQIRQYLNMHIRNNRHIQSF